jgi:DivIVA domain-containing protein
MNAMEWVLWMIAVAVLGLGAVAASGRLGSMPGTITDTPRPHLPTGVLDAAALREARFTVVTRGYSMDQVDELLDRLARQLESAPESQGTIRADVEPPWEPSER